MYLCNGCDGKFREEELAPYMRDMEGAYVLACRKCISKWNGEFLNPIVFWMRRVLLDPRMKDA